MKKALLFIFLPLISFFSLSAQTTQTEADSIVKERMSNNTSHFIIYGKDSVQTSFEITTTTSEIIELDYPCWVYFVNFKEKLDSKYLIVKESNGNLLEINKKNDGIPDDLEDWRELVDVEYPIEIPFEDFSLTEPSCEWINIVLDPGLYVMNTQEESKNFIVCTDGTYPVDFSQHALLMAIGHTTTGIVKLEKHLQQISYREFNLHVDIKLGTNQVGEKWVITIKTPKFPQNAIINLIEYQHP